MPVLRMPAEELDRRGVELYDGSIRSIVETTENIGKEIVINVETGEYEIDDDGLRASRRLLARDPDAQLYGLRIGYNAVCAIGGVLERTPPR